MRLRMLQDTARVMVGSRSCTVALADPGAGFFYGAAVFDGECGRWLMMQGENDTRAAAVWRSGFDVVPARVPQAVARALVRNGLAEWMDGAAP